MRKFEIIAYGPWFHIDGDTTARTVLASELDVASKLPDHEKPHLGACLVLRQLMDGRITGSVGSRSAMPLHVGAQQFGEEVKRMAGMKDWCVKPFVKAMPALNFEVE